MGSTSNRLDGLTTDRYHGNEVREVVNEEILCLCWWEKELSMEEEKYTEESDEIGV